MQIAGGTLRRRVEGLSEQLAVQHPVHRIQGVRVYVAERAEATGLGLGFKGARKFGISGIILGNSCGKTAIAFRHIHGVVCGLGPAVTYGQHELHFDPHQREN